jgi:hypothetical protein
MDHFSMGERAKMQTQKQTYPLAAIATMIIAIGYLGCKPVEGDRMASSIRTLDNFAAADGTDFVVNSCSDERVGFTELTKRTDVYKDRIKVPAKGWVDSDWTDVYSSLVAVPPGIRSVFFDGLSGRIEITPDSDAICRGKQKDGGKNKGGGGEGSKFYGCWFLETTGPKIVINSEKSNGHRKWVRHSLVREFGYITAEHLISWEYKRRVENANQWYWELRPRPWATEGDGAFVEMLGKTFEQEVTDIVEAGSTKKYSLDRFKKDPAFENTLSKWIFAEAFDSYFCSRTTEQKFKSEFPKTYELFSQHFSKQLGQVNLTSIDAGKKPGVVAAAAVPEKVVPAAKQVDTPKVSSKIVAKNEEIVEEKLPPAEDEYPEVEIVTQDENENSYDGSTGQVKTIYVQQPEQTVYVEPTSGTSYVRDIEDEDSTCGICGAMSGIGRGLLAGGLGFVSLARSYGYPRGVTPYGSYPASSAGNCSWPTAGGGVSGYGGYNPMGQGQMFPGGQYSESFSGQVGAGGQIFQNQIGYGNDLQQQGIVQNQQQVNGNMQIPYGGIQNQNSLVSNQYAGCNQNQNLAQTNADQLAKQEAERQRILQQSQAQTQAATSNTQDSSNSWTNNNDTKPAPRPVPRPAKSSSACGVVSGAAAEQSGAGILLISAMFLAAFVSRTH